MERRRDNPLHILHQIRDTCIRNVKSFIPFLNDLNDSEHDTFIDIKERIMSLKDFDNDEEIDRLISGKAIEMTNTSLQIKKEIDEFIKFYKDDPSLSNEDLFSKFPNLYEVYHGDSYDGYTKFDAFKRLNDELEDDYELTNIDSFIEYCLN
jgi:hypothetical protein